jgi:hypothetical protein
MTPKVRTVQGERVLLKLDMNRSPKKKLDVFFPAKKAADERWEVVSLSPSIF